MSAGPNNLKTKSPHFERGVWAQSYPSAMDEHHEQTAKAHRTAAQQHGTNDHVGAKQQSAQAVEKSKAAHEHSTQANNKSQQR